MATEVIMPRLTHDMQTGVFMGWLKQEGDLISIGDPLFEVETDKAVSEVAAEASGVLRGISCNPGDEIPIGTTIAFILQEDEELPEFPTSAPSTATLHSPIMSAAPSLEKTPSKGLKGGSSPTIANRIIATPIARRIAREHQLDLGSIPGRGPRGRILEADVRSHLASTQGAGISLKSSEAAFTALLLTRYQRIAGTRLQHSVQTAPHFHLEVDVDMGEAIRWRERVNQSTDLRISLSSILVKVVAHALSAHPRLNATFDQDFVRLLENINIGLAVAVEQGLLVPVVHQADRLSITQIQQTLKDLRIGAEAGKLKPDQLSGGTFTISNLGMYGIDRFQAIINPPEAAILAVGRIRQLPQVTEEGIVERPMMNLRLSIDHRLLDGATAAPFLVEIRETLENPDPLT